MLTKKELLQRFAPKDVIKNKMITVAGQTFNENQKETNISNQIIQE